MAQSYSVAISETLYKRVIVEADSFRDAIELAEELYGDGKIVLTSEDYDGYEILSAVPSDSYDERYLPKFSVEDLNE